MPEYRIHILTEPRSSDVKEWRIPFHRDDRNMELAYQIEQSRRDVDPSNDIITIGFHGNPNTPQATTLSFRLEWTRKGVPLIRSVAEVHAFPPSTTLEEVLQWELARIEAVKDSRDNVQAQANQWRQEQQSAWTEQHGSDVLKRLTAKGYDATAQYLEERLALEFPPFILAAPHTGCQWRERRTPSLAAFEESERIEAETGYPTWVVWVTKWQGQTLRGREQKEGILIREYLGKYDLLKLADSTEDDATPDQ